jgi:hypothetical protein
MQHTFPTAAFVVGEGVSRRVGTARGVVLVVEQAPSGEKTADGSPFLSGQIRAEGTLLEECLPNRSLLAVGREAVLKLAAGERWAQTGILILKLGEIRTPEPGRRLYQWSFLVTGKPRDVLRAFPDRAPGQVELESLLTPYES